MRVKRAAFLGSGLAVAWLGGACGGHASSEDDNSTRDAGACGLDGVCEEQCDGDPDCAEAGIDAPPAKGASNFVITSGGCNVNGAFAIPEGTQPTTDRYLGARVEDGQDDADVDCQVAASGEGYIVAAYVQQGQRRLNLAADLLPFGGASYTGPATVTHYASETGALSSQTDCTASVNPDQDVAPGRIWGNFACDVGDPNQPTVRCTAEGSFAFENCER